MLVLTGTVASSSSRPRMEDAVSYGARAAKECAIESSIVSRLFASAQ
jgi:hypothetical protein